MSLRLSLECPRGEGHWAARQGQKLSRGNFYSEILKPIVRNFSARNSGAGNGRANFMGAWDFLVLSAGKPPMPIKFLLVGGGGSGLFRRGGGSANFIFMGAGIFPIHPAANTDVSLGPLGNSSAALLAPSHLPALCRCCSLPHAPHQSQWHTVRLLEGC